MAGSIVDSSKSIPSICPALRWWSTGRWSLRRADLDGRLSDRRHFCLRNDVCDVCVCVLFDYLCSVIKVTNNRDVSLAVLAAGENNGFWSRRSCISSFTFNTTTKNLYLCIIITHFILGYVFKPQSCPYKHIWCIRSHMVNVICLCQVDTVYRVIASCLILTQRLTDSRINESLATIPAIFTVPYHTHHTHSIYFEFRSYCTIHQFTQQQLCGHICWANTGVTLWARQGKYIRIRPKAAYRGPSRRDFERMNYIRRYDKREWQTSLAFGVWSVYLCIFGMDKSQLIGPKHIQARTLGKYTSIQYLYTKNHIYIYIHTCIDYLHCLFNLFVKRPPTAARRSKGRDMSWRRSYIYRIRGVLCISLV